MKELNLNNLVTKELIARYSTNAPRYTSYPTAVEMKEGFGDWREILKEYLVNTNSSSPLSLYFHLPFCKSLCYFCACNKIITSDIAETDPYIDLLIKEMDIYADLGLEGREVIQLHWGGGTPNYFSAALLERLFKEASKRFKINFEIGDISSEIDPRTVTEEQIRTLKEVGFNRISFGVQDFNPDVQKAINRIQPFEVTKQVVDWSRSVGFKSINIDLIYGLPLQTIEQFNLTIDRILDLKPERIALYGYAHVTWLHKVQNSFNRLPLPSAEERIALFMLALTRLTEAGYLYVGMDHFVLENDLLADSVKDKSLNRNFMGYSTIKGVNLIGFGYSSISCLANAFSQNEKDLVRYKERVERGELPSIRGLIKSHDDLVRGEVIERIMCGREVDFKEIEDTFDIDFNSYFESELSSLDEFLKDQFIIFNFDNSSDADDCYKGESGSKRPISFHLTELGRVFSRNIAAKFDSYLLKHQAKDKKTFSQTV